MTEHNIGPLAALADERAARFDLGDTRVCVVRNGGDVYAINDVCSHADISLSEGEVICEDLEIECWKHGSAFSLVTGIPSTLPATQPVAVYVTHIRSGDVIIEVP